LIILLVKSLGLTPKYSPLIVTLVPGGPSFGEIPVTTGLLAICKELADLTLFKTLFGNYLKELN
jgi:hypothetical protein